MRRWHLQVFAFDLDPDLEYKQVSERYLGAIKAWAEDAAAGGETSDCAFYLFVDDDAYIHMQAWEALLNRPGVDAGAIWCEGAFRCWRRCSLLSVNLMDEATT